MHVVEDDREGVRVEEDFIGAGKSQREGTASKVEMQSELSRVGCDEFVWNLG